MQNYYKKIIIKNEINLLSKSFTEGSSNITEGVVITYNLIGLVCMCCRIGKDCCSHFTCIFPNNRSKCFCGFHRCKHGGFVRRNKNKEIEKRKEEIFNLSSTMTHQSTQLQSQLKQLQEELRGRDKKELRFAPEIRPGPAATERLPKCICTTVSKSRRENTWKCKPEAKEPAWNAAKRPRTCTTDFQKQAAAITAWHPDTPVDKHNWQSTTEDIVNLNLQISNFRSEMQEQEKQALQNGNAGKVMSRRP